MAKYFTISNGLRGCYMPDSSYVRRVDTRRELKAALTDVIRDCTDARFSKRDVASLAAEMWRDAQSHAPSYLPRAFPMPDNRAYAVFISTATRRDYVDYQRETEGF